MAFSFLSRRKKEEQNYSPMQNFSRAPQQQQQNQDPYAIASMADGRVRYSDGSIRGQVRQPAQTPQPKKQASQPQQANAPNIYQQYAQQRGQQTQQRIGDVGQRAQQQVNLQKKLQQSRADTLGNIADLSGQSYKNYTDQLRGGLDIRRGTAERQIGSVRRDYDQQRLQNEQSRQERMKGLENTLASLGTLQSSAFGNVGARINQGAERMDRQAQRQLNNTTADIRDQVRLAENEVESLIAQEGNRYRQQLAQIQGSLDENSIQYQQAVQAITDQANQRINSLLDNLDKFTYDAQMQMMGRQQGETGGLSQQFLQTGQPATREDMLYAAQNPDAVDEIQRMVSGGVTPQEMQERQRTMSLVDELLNSNLTPVSGAIGQLGFLQNLGIGSNQRAALNQLIGRLALDERGKLRGQGQISDRETQMLQDAVTRLNTPGLSQDDIKRELMRIKQTLGGSLQSINQPDRLGIL